MKKIFLFYILFQCWNVCQLQAQSSNPYFLPKVFPKTPNSSALEKYGDYQVNLFTGVPDISIPLYEIKAGDLTVPITLSYHASGIKVTDIASWAGLGWSLSAGGEISRKIMGNHADEQALSGYLYTNLRHPSTLTMNNDADLRYVDNIRMGITDVEPDIFSYNFPGKSGKFFFNRMGTDKIQLVPFSPIKVNRTVTTQSNTNYLSFNIMDESGNQFSFGNSEREITNVGQPNFANSSWMLEKMISQNKRDTVSFLYSSSTLNMSDVSMFQTLSDNVQHPGTNPPYTSGLQSAITNPVFSSTYQKLNQEIDFKNGRLVFGLSANDRQDVSSTNIKSLNNINVYGYNYATGQYSLQKTITFYQSYFTGFPNDYTTKRLRLDSLYISDASGSVIQRYRFDYNNDISVPSYTTFARDYWGYFNNQSNSSLIPQQQVFFQAESYSQNITVGSTNPIGRDPDPDNVKLCMLKTITYPTGGHTDFDYQSNQYVENGNVKLGGGLRITSIKSYDGINSNPIVKTYKYESARKNFVLDNFSFVKEQTYRFYGNDPGFTGTVLRATKRLRTFCSSPAIDPLPFDGATVVYPIVTEFIGNETVNTGKTTFMFTDIADQYFGNYPVFDRAIVNSFFYARGQISEKDQYRYNSDGSFQIMQKEIYQYAAFPQTGYDQVVGLTGAKNVINEGDFGNDVYLGTSTSGSISTPSQNDLNSFSYLGYPILSDDNYLTSKIVTSYDQNDVAKFLTTTTQYQYDNILHQQANRIITTNSKNNTLTTLNKYPADYLPVQASSTGNALIDAMLSENLLAAPIETYQNLTIASDTKTLSSKLNTYKQINANAIELDNIKTLEIASTVADFTPSTLVSGQLQYDARYKNVITFDAYDGLGNLLQFTPRNASSTAILYDYNKAYPIAEVKNAVTNDIAYTSFEAEGGGNWEIASNNRNNSDNITGKLSYSLSDGSIVKRNLTSGKSYTVSYWMKGGAYAVSGASVQSTKTGKTFNNWTNYIQQIITTSNIITISGTGLIDELRLYPKEAQMTTYTYDPLIGMTCKNDVNNLISYFEYDGFNRLKNIRDNEQKIVKRFQYQYASSSGDPNSTIFTPSSLTTVLNNYRQIDLGGATFRLRDYNYNYFPDTRQTFSNGIAQLPEAYRGGSPVFYNAMEMFLRSGAFCFTQDGYSIEFRVKAPTITYDNSKNVYFITTGTELAVFIDLYGTGSDGVNLYGFGDVSGNSYGAANGGNGFGYILADPTHGFNDYQNIRLKVTKSRYYVYYNNNLVKDFPRDNNIAIAPISGAGLAYIGNAGSFDWFKVYDKDDNLKYVENFDTPTQPTMPDPLLLCPQPTNCQARFTTYFNQAMGTNYTYSQINTFYVQATGQALNICN